MKKYIITETQYEYNDENYYRGEGSGGNPKFLMSDKYKAIDKLTELNIAEFRRILTEDYYGLNSFYFDCNIDDLNSIISPNTINITPDLYGYVSNYEMVKRLIEIKLSDDQVLALMKLFNLEFYELFELEET